MAGTEAGEVLRSQSAIANEIRSIMAVPVMPGESLGGCSLRG